ncbi:MAG: ABC transporter ATP-binding protein/permease [Defluviitaleaceae bacterium]|nr:ABC transporter ATP-binding protein/permease [Defluviitaleaceae bacterium]
MFRGVSFIISFCNRHNKKFIPLVFLANILKGLTPFISIIIPGIILDEIIGQSRLEILILYILILCFGNFFSTWFSSYISIIADRQKKILYNKFTLNLSENIMKTDFLHLESSSFLNSKEKAYKFIFGDGRGFMAIIDDFSNMVSNLITVIGLIGIISLLNVWVGLVMIFVIAVSSYFDYKYQKDIIDINMEKVQVERNASYFSHIIENFQYGKEMRIFNLNSWITNKYKKVLEELYNFNFKASKIVMKSYSVKLIVQLVENLFRYLYLIFSVISGSITVGNFTIYLNAMNSVSSAFKSLSNNYVKILSQEKYYDEFDKFIKLPITIDNNSKFRLEKNFEIESIEYKNVSFTYPNQTNPVLKNINLKIDKLEKIAIVGENGAGKSTFIKLLVRLYEPTEGNIYLNGMNIRDIDYNDYSKLFSTIFQDYKLFSFSIRENIALFQDYKLFSFSIRENIALEEDKDINDGSIIQSLKDSGLYRKINSLQNGIYTNIYKIFDNNGIELSGGELQKLALARSLYRNSKVIVLDEPTSSLDPNSEIQMYNNIGNLIKDKIAICITHRLSSTKFCDKILVLHKGIVLEYGTHSELVNNKGMYYNLYNAQATQFDIAL